MTQMSEKDRRAMHAQQTEAYLKERDAKLAENARVSIRAQRGGWLLHLRRVYIGRAKEIEQQLERLGYGVE